MKISKLSLRLTWVTMKKQEHALNRHYELVISLQLTYLFLISVLGIIGTGRIFFVLFTLNKILTQFEGNW